MLSAESPDLLAIEPQISGAGRVDPLTRSVDGQSCTVMFAQHAGVGPKLFNEERPAVQINWSILVETKCVLLQTWEIRPLQKTDRTVRTSKTLRPGGRGKSTLP